MFFNSITKLRNSKFTKSKFLNLQFHKHPIPVTDITEGYSSISFPITIKYDKNLHQSYKNYYENEKYHQADVLVQSEPSRRYDLILEEPYNTYVADGLVVRTKGYENHRYKRFV